MFLLIVDGIHKLLSRGREELCILSSFKHLMSARDTPTRPAKELEDPEKLLHPHDQQLMNELMNE